MKILLILLASFSVAAQEINIESLAQLQDSILKVEQEIQQKHRLLKTRHSRELRNKLRELREKKTHAENQFIFSVTGIDLNQTNVTQEDKDLFKEFQQLISPALDGLKRISERPRKIEAYRNQLDQLQQELLQLKQAQEKVSAMLKASEYQVLIPQLKTTLQTLEDKENAWELEKQTTENLLTHELGNKKSFFQTVQDIVSTFFRTKGKNLLVALLGFLLIYFSLRLLRNRIFNLSFVKRHFHALIRPITALYNLATILLSALGAILCLYIMHDWLLVTVIVLLLMGILWSFKNIIPQFLNELRLIFNLGPVREGELIIFNGIPWKVKKISFYSVLINDQLQSGRIRIPVKELANLYSRPLTTDETCFPTRLHDWILLPEEQLAQIICQTPTQVVVKKNNGGVTTFKTEDFWGMEFENLTRGFRIFSILGLDYCVQAQMLTDILPYFQSYFKEHLSHSGIQDISLDFNDCGADSLNLLLTINCDGDLASQYKALKRKIQQLFLAACNEKNLGIPFRQLTIHQANQQ